MHELDVLLRNPLDEEQADDAPPLPEIAASQPGDLWLCGEHRVLCGDATNAEAIARLLGDHKPRLLVCDPPYGISLDSEWRDRAGIKGPKHPMFCARVLGEFPTQSAYSVYSLELIERAKRDPTPEEIEKLKTMPIQVGIDVAGPGEDERVLFARSGGAILEIHVFPEHDPRGRVAQVLSGLKKFGRPLTVVVDVVGIGYNFALHLADMDFTVFQFNAGFRPMDTDRFVNSKAEAYWGLREWMEQGQICCLNDLETEAQLSAILYRATSSGKTEMRARRMRGNLASRRPIGPKRLSWRSAGLCRASRPSLSASAL